MNDCGCTPKTYNIGMGCCQPVLAPIENYYTKSQVDRLIKDIETEGGCCITPEEVDAKIEAIDLSPYALKTEIPSLDNYALKSELPDLSGYATKTEIPSLVGYATEDWVRNQNYLTSHQSLKTINGISLIGTGNIEISQGETVDLSDYYNRTEVNNLLADKLDSTAYTPADLSSYALKSEIPSLDGYATESWVLEKHYITGVDLSNYATLGDIPDTSDYALKSEIPSLDGYATQQWVRNQNYITGVDLSNYATKSEIPSLDSYALKSELPDLSGYATKSEIPDISGKLDTSVFNTYTANTDTAISSKADASTTYTKTEVNNLISSKADTTVLNNYMLKSQIWCGTQSEYDAISTKDNNVIYLIHE